MNSVTSIEVPGMTYQASVYQHQIALGFLVMTRSRTMVRNMIASYEPYGSTSVGTAAGAGTTKSSVSVALVFSSSSKVSSYSGTHGSRCSDRAGVTPLVLQRRRLQSRIELLIGHKRPLKDNVVPGHRLVEPWHLPGRQRHLFFLAHYCWNHRRSQC